MAIELKILEFASNHSAESGTTSTNIKVTNHGLVTGDMIINVARKTPGDTASRRVAKVDNNNFTVLNVDGQTTGDTIKLYHYIDRFPYVKQDSLNLQLQSDNRHSCTFAMIISDTYKPKVGQYIQLYQDGVLAFGGAIKEIQKTRYTPSGTKMLYYISSEGFGHIPSRRTITTQYTDRKAGDIVTDVIDRYLYMDGITKGTIADGATLAEYPDIIPDMCVSIKQVLDDVAEASGFKWWIDDYGALHFVQDGTITDAPHTIEIGQAFTDFADIEVTESTINYRNKQFLKGGVDNYGNQILLNIDLQSEIDDRQESEGGTGVYGNIIDDPNIALVLDKTAESGTTTTNLKITAHGLLTGDTVYNATREAKLSVIKVDADNVTTASVTGQTAGDEIRYWPDANKAIRNNLKKYGKVPIELSFTSKTVDWRPNTKLFVNLPEFDVASKYFLIESVDITESGGRLTARVQATLRDESDFSTQASENYNDMFASFAKKKTGDSGPLKSAGTANGSTVLVPKASKAKGMVFEYTKVDTTVQQIKNNEDGITTVGTGTTKAVRNISFDSMEILETNDLLSQDITLPDFSPVLSTDLVDSDVDTSTKIATQLNYIRKTINDNMGG